MELRLGFKILEIVIETSFLSEVCKLRAEKSLRGYDKIPPLRAIIISETVKSTEENQTRDRAVKAGRFS